MLFGRVYVLFGRVNVLFGRVNVLFGRVNVLFGRVNVARLIDKRFQGLAKGVGTQKILGRVHLLPLKIGMLSLVITSHNCRIETLSRNMCHVAS